MDGPLARQLRLYAALIGAAIVLAAPGFAATPSGNPLPWHVDASLADVSFIDLKHGWAVGDRGVIWHTVDGGANWQLQTSGVDCRLESVQFLDAQNGWAAGGYTEAYTHLPVGVLLRTTDGGESWTPETRFFLPAIRRVRFITATHGFMLTRSTASCPSGAFVTTNGGRQWSPLTSDRFRDCLAGDFLDQDQGMLAGTGWTATAHNKQIESHQSTGLRTARAMRFVGEGQGWLAGDGGMISVTPDAGQHWLTPAGALPPGVEQFDFKSLEVRGRQCWAAGSPGTRILHTSNGGQTWQWQDTGQPLPIQAITFVDDLHGWAVGELGLVLQTADGGATWRTQRAAGRRLAMLGFFDTADRVPLEVFAKLGADDGYLARAVVVGRQDMETPSADTQRQGVRLHEAVVGAGGTGAEQSWRFPLRQAGLQVNGQRATAGWDWANAGRGMTALEAHLVYQIRLWQPEIVFAPAQTQPRVIDEKGQEDASLVSSDSAADFIASSLEHAVEAAADPQQFPELLSQAGLRPWAVKRVFRGLAPGAAGGTTINRSDLVPWLGKSLADVCSRPDGILHDAFESKSEASAFGRLNAGVVDATPHVDFFEGLSLAVGGAARRAAPASVVQGLEGYQQAARQRRNLIGMMQHRIAKQPGADWVGQLENMTRGLHPEAVGDVLFELGQHYSKAGRPDLADQVFAQLAKDHPKHPLTPAALIWRIHFHCSAEAKLRQPDTSKVVRQASADSPLDERGVARPEGEVRPAFDAAANRTAVPIGAVGPEPGRSAGASEQAALEACQQLAGLRSAAVAEPSVVFPLASLQRGGQTGPHGERLLSSLRRSRPHDAWWNCAAGETRLGDTGPQRLKEAYACKTAHGRPTLDGKLDDLIWSGAAEARLASSLGDDGGWPAVAKLAYDREFLYFAVQCRRHPESKYEPAAGARTRDSELAAEDRFELLLDIDRDWTTFHRLAVDHRGWTHESSCGDVTWNPAWYVAAGGDADTWTVEGAIPLAELSGTAPSPHQPWAMGLQRIVPGVGFQSWTQPAGPIVRPEGFGLLRFED